MSDTRGSPFFVPTLLTISASGFGPVCGREAAGRRGGANWWRAAGDPGASDSDDEDDGEDDDDGADAAAAAADDDDDDGGGGAGAHGKGKGELCSCCKKAVAQQACVKAAQLDGSGPPVHDFASPRGRAKPVRDKAAAAAAGGGGGSGAAASSAAAAAADDDDPHSSDDKGGNANPISWSLARDTAAEQSAEAADRRALRRALRFYQVHFGHSAAHPRAYGHTLGFPDPSRIVRRYFARLGAKECLAQTSQVRRVTLTLQAGAAAAAAAAAGSANVGQLSRSL
jgi:hypothetical protein